MRKVGEHMEAYIDRYWNPILETIPLEELRDLELRKFKRILQWGFDRSRFHRKLYDEVGLEPADIKTFNDIRLVPKVEKAMMHDIQGKDPFPYGDSLCAA